MRAKISAIAASTWQICFIAVALIVMSTCSAFAGKAITGIDVTNKADRMVITVKGNETLSMMPFSSTVGKYLGFQFPASLSVKSRLVKINSGAIFCVKYSNFRSYPPCSRIVVNTSASLKYSTNWSADKKTLQITIWKRGQSPAASASEELTTVLSSDKDKSVKLTVLPPLPSMASPDVEAAALVAEPVVKREIKAPPVRLTAGSRKAYEAIHAAAMATRASYQMAASSPNVTSRVLGMVETEGKLPVSVTKPAPAPVMVAQAAAVPSQEKRVSLNFLGADINDVLKALSLQSGANIVASKEVKGEVTVSLNNVNMEEALDYITKPNGLSYEKDNETYLVAVANKVAPTIISSNVSEVFALHYVRSAEVIGILEKLFPDLKVSGSKSSESSSGGEGEKKNDKSQVIEFVAVSASPESMAEITSIINQLEESVKNNMASLTTEVYVIKYADPKTLAESITKLVPGVMVGCVPASVIAPNAPGSVITTDMGSVSVTKAQEQEVSKNPNYQSLVLSGPAEQVLLAKELVAKLDVKAPLISIEARVTSINKAGEEKLGIKWNWSSFNFSEALKVLSFVPKDPDTGEAVEGTKPLLGASDKYVRSPLTFGAVLDALVTNGNAKVLASPNLLCLDGMPGVFFVGDEVTYIERIETTPTGQNIKTATKQVGVQLRVLGDVSPDGYITLNIHPEVSTLKLTTQEGVNLPILSRRYTDHVVRVKDGETIAIGGLIRSDEIHDMSKVPLLGDLPFLGKLFQHKTKTKSETEVVMFITAKVVED